MKFTHLNPYMTYREQMDNLNDLIAQASAEQLYELENELFRYLKQLEADHDAEIARLAARMDV